MRLLLLSTLPLFLALAAALALCRRVAGSEMAAVLADTYRSRRDG